MHQTKNIQKFVSCLLIPGQKNKRTYLFFLNKNILVGFFGGTNKPSPPLTSCAARIRDFKLSTSDRSLLGPTGEGSWKKNSDEPRKKNPYYFPLYWIVNRDPYSGALSSLYNWVVHLEIRTWMFPKIVVPPHHPILIGFSIIFTIHFGGNTHYFGKHPYAAGASVCWGLSISGVLTPLLKKGDSKLEKNNTHHFVGEACMIKLGVPPLNTNIYVYTQKIHQQIRNSPFGEILCPP